MYGLLNNRVLEVSEGTKVTANITIECTQDGILQNKEFIKTLRIYNRNAIMWDDDRKAL